METAPERRLETERRLSPAEVEAVLGRAIELQVRDEIEPAGERLAESDLVRIGGELGLEPAHVRRALAEVDGGLGPAGRGWLDRHVGPRVAGASRVVARDGATVRRQLDRHLRERECMVVERRTAGVTVYVKGQGLVSAAARTLGKLRARHPLLGAERLEAAVQDVDGGSCCVVLSVDLSGTRREHTALGGGLGAVGATAAGAAAAVLVAPPLAVVGAPLVLAGIVGGRLAYRNTVAETERRVLSLLDRLAHGEL